MAVAQTTAGYRPDLKQLREGVASQKRKESVGQLSTRTRGARSVTNDFERMLQHLFPHLVSKPKKTKPFAEAERRLKERRKRLKTTKRKVKKIRRERQHAEWIARENPKPCGAMTKKGTPCARRAYADGRCPTHGGVWATKKPIPLARLKPKPSRDVETTQPDPRWQR